MTETAGPVRPAAEVQPHILLIEDQERTAHGLQELLSIEGFRVTCASDGPSGLYAARAYEMDAIVLDVRLPGMDGFAVCRALREDETTRHVPIVMLTGLGDTPSKLQGFEMGADDYLVKPVPARELAARLRKLIANRLAVAAELHDRRVKVISEIAAAISQELSAPLAQALGTLDLTLLRSGIAADIRQDLSQCRQRLWEMASTLTQLTDAPAAGVAAPSPDRMSHLMPEGHA